MSKLLKKKETEEDEKEEKKREEGGRERRKRVTVITVIKEVHKSDTFFTFVNVDYVTGETTVFIGLLRKWLYLLCFSLLDSILFGVTIILERAETQDKNIL